MATFQDIQHEIQNIMDLDTELNEEQSKAWYEYMEELKEQRADKIDAFVSMLRLSMKRVKGLREEAQALLSWARAIENRADSLKQHYFFVMTGANLTKVNGNKHCISIRNTKSVQVDDVDALPTEYKKITVEARKSDIKKALESGKAIPGCSIVENQSLNIR